MIKEYIWKVVEGGHLSLSEAEEAMNLIMQDKATNAQIASLITALRIKGETIDEITGFARAMRKNALRIEVKARPLVDTCGTGGDRLNTFNISTLAAFVVAGAGIAVAKHGNRAVSSSCGSADLLEAMGVNIEMRPEKVAECIDKIGFGFLFAPIFHPAMKFAIGPRREMGIRTVFNILGPLTNPANASAQIMGTYDPDLTSVLARVLANLGLERAFVVHGFEGLDEVSTIGETKITELKDGKIKTYSLTASHFGLKPVQPEDIQAASIKENINITEDVLHGKKGPRRDIVLFNAALGIVVGGLAKEVEEGIKLAEASIDNGKAWEKLQLLREFSR